MQRKIFKAGNSLVISIPREGLQLLGVTEGSVVDLMIDPTQKQVIIRAKVDLKGEIDEKFAAQIDEFIEKYRPALETLAQ